jgi:hypothetical protein
MKQELRLELALYQESDEASETLRCLQPYLEHECPTTEVPMTRSDCIAEAHDRARLGSHEAEAYWLLMAAAL